MTDPVSQHVSSDIFRPPPRGDVALRSSDGVEFQAHSVLLSLASPVFEGLSVVGTTKDVVELSETAETISLMLRFIYPNEKMPMMTSFEMLAQCLGAAHKYDLEGMLGTIDDQLSTKAIPQSLLHQDPIRSYDLALQFNLPQTRALAMPLVITGNIDFSDPMRLGELVKSYSSTIVIRLAAIQSTREKILANVLLRFYNAPIAPGPENSSMFQELSCLPCIKWLLECDKFDARKGLPTENPPSWLLAWADLAYETLLHAPLEESDKLFNWSILEKLKGKSRVCQQCLDDFWTRTNQQEQFNEWAQGVRSVLKQRLDGLEHMSAL